LKITINEEFFPVAFIHDKHFLTQQKYDINVNLPISDYIRSSYLQEISTHVCDYRY
jgi:hypothetical protein